MAHRTIFLKGRGIAKEAPAGGAITPGHLIMRNSSDQFVVHGTAAGNAVKMFARENELAGRGIDTAYAVGEQVLAEVMPPGAEVYALVAAAAPAITKGDYLESAGNGTLRKAATSAATSEAQRAGIIARALESVDNSAGGSAVRIQVEIV